MERETPEIKPSGPPGARRKGDLIKCALCHHWRPATFEHSPPESCGNTDPVVALDWSAVTELVAREGHDYKGHKVFTTDILDRPDVWPKQTLQRGHGYNTLCRECNSALGGYNTALKYWEEAARAGRCADGLVIQGEFYMLKVIKAILAQFLSANRDVANDRRFARFLRHRLNTALPKPYRLFAYARSGTMLRSTGFFYVLAPDREWYVFSEVHTPAIGYVLSRDGEKFHPDWVEIGQFGRCPFGKRQAVEIVLPALPVLTPIPGDFRTEDQRTAGVLPPMLGYGGSGSQSRAHFKK